MQDNLQISREKNNSDSEKSNFDSEINNDPRWLPPRLPRGNDTSMKKKETNPYKRIPIPTGFSKSSSKFKKSYKRIEISTGFSKSRTKLKEQEQYQQAFLKAVLNSKRMKVQQTQLITIRNNLLTVDKGASDCCTDEHGCGLGDSNETKHYYFYGSRVYFSKNNTYGPRVT